MRSRIRRMSIVLSGLMVIGCVCASNSPVLAQAFEDPLNLLGGKGLAQSSAPEVEITLSPQSAKPGDEVTLAVKLKVPADGYTYSTNPSFSGATRFSLKSQTGLKPLGDGFESDHAPKEVFEPLFDQKVEKFTSEVTWLRKFRVLPDAKLDQVLIEGTMRYQVCDANSCTPYEESIKASLANGPAPTAEFVVTSQETREVHPFVFETTPQRGRAGNEKSDPLTLRFELSPENAKPGDTVTLKITMALQDEWHTFALTQNPKNYGRPTVLTLGNTSGLKPVGEFVASREPKLETPLDDKVQQTHYGTISWSHEFTVTEGSAADGIGVAGEISYQICSHGRCLPSKTVEFLLGSVTNGPAEPPQLAEAGDLGKSLGLTLADDFVIEKDDASGSLAWYLFAAFFGGMILNVMPCVLPVIAIKVMSFVQQAGEDRKRVLALNLSYSAGVISVFLVLATLAVVLGLGWGGLFQSSKFNLIMSCIVFAMGLSLLGVFEIPVPGFVGSAAGSQHREGLMGAFSTGVFATLLATPCSGPLLGTTLGWSIQQPAAITYLIWSVMGLGMASPYVVFGLFPAAVKWLPRPGNWMVRLKEFSGFVLMGTVIFFITFLERAYTIPMLIMLLGIALGLWMIGNLYDINTHIRHKTTVRVVAITLTSVICGFGYSLADTSDKSSSNELPWVAFSETELQNQLAQNKTVLVDFTADWCLVCKMNEKLALNTPETLSMVEEHGIVTLYADYTHESEEIKRWLGKFESISVPLTVVFPAGQPQKPIIIRDAYLKSTLLEKLNEAVSTPAQTSVAAAASATRVADNSRQ